jgi:hypothetical protein
MADHEGELEVHREFGEKPVVVGLLQEACSGVRFRQLFDFRVAVH